MSRNDAEYFQKRALAERARAEAAGSNAAAIRHFELAEHYEERARAPQLPVNPTLPG